MERTFDAIQETDVMKFTNREDIAGHGERLRHNVELTDRLASVIARSFGIIRAKARIVQIMIDGSNTAFHPTFNLSD